MIELENLSQISIEQYLEDFYSDNKSRSFDIDSDNYELKVYTEKFEAFFNEFKEIILK